jgi:hypothetical protein
MKKILLTFALFLLLFSCNESHTENKPLVENAIDNTDSSIKGSFGSSRDENSIDRTYYEIIKNDKKLSAFDDQIVKNYENYRKIIATYDNILSKSEAFYRDASYQVNTITDSALKYQTEKQITASSNQYKLKIKNIRILIAALEKNNEKVNNLYTSFKIRKTLPEIAKYQNAHPLKTDSLENFIKKQDQLLDQLKKLK